MRRTRYAYRKRALRLAAGAFDALGATVGRLRWRTSLARPPRPRRLLLVRLDHLGDGLFLGPALAALRTALPQVELVLLAGPWSETLYRRGRRVDAIEVRTVPWFARPRKGGGLGAWIEILRWVRAGRFDAAIDFRGDVRHLAWLALAGIPTRLGYGRTGGGFWLTHRVPYRDVHEVERNLDLVRVLAPEAVAGPLLPVDVGDEDVQAADAFLREVGAGGARGPVVFHVTAGYPSKCWEPASMARAIDLVQESDLGPVVVVGLESERPEITAVIGHTRRPPPVLAGRTSLAQLAALLQRARAFVGHDSGPAHLAVANRVPSVLVYSGVNALRSWGPWGERVRVLHTEVECSPCGLAVCDRDHECMRHLTPEAVLAALREIALPHDGSAS